ncbi:MAG: hypothetical protein CMJ32_11290 [Phycisphaerae bacterium]|nr:hypothetical protein [Phycisphaerae bacterium]
MFTVFIILSCILAKPASGQQQFYETVNVNGVNRQYLVYLPTDFDPAENLPVMFHFHGGDESPEVAIQSEVDYRSLANVHRFIAVYPAALLDGKGCTCWNNEGKYSNGIDELGFAEAMIDSMVAGYNADPSRMYASGFSLGGSLTWDLACFLGDRFAAVGVVAANMWEWTYNDCTSALPIGICHILGTNDFYAPYNGNQYSISTAQQNAFWVSVNGASNTPIEDNLGGGVTRFLWPAKEDCHSVVHYRRQGGEHDWPTFARDAIWEFVSQYSLDGLIECLEDCPADLNGDGVVDGVDLGILLAGWKRAGGDIDGDGTTNGVDIGLMLAAWGACNSG